MNEATPEAAAEQGFNKEQELVFQNQVLALIDEQIRPALMSHAGDINVHGFNQLATGGYELQVELIGACGSCPSSMMTMKMGIERTLQHHFPQIQLITQV